MHISKLTISPIFSKTAAIVIDNPSVESASILIKERLASKYGFQHAVRPKMPKFFKRVCKS